MLILVLGGVRAGAMGWGTVRSEQCMSALVVLEQAIYVLVYIYVFLVFVQSWPLRRNTGVGSKLTAPACLVFG